MLQDDHVLPPNPRLQGIFANMIFALSIDNSAQRESVGRLICENGDILLENSFAELFESSFGLKAQYVDKGFAALLADKHSRKEKYMQANHCVWSNVTVPALHGGAAVEVTVSAVKGANSRARM